ncbi:MAG: fold metallo-hydrolase [Verrucomicrobiaceae bacterium]|nr:fold metallo-hydrolase [Verrucomicrobiaceae bacterium]
MTAPIEFQQADIVRFQPVQISPLARRFTAGNAGIMTGPGTNSYVVGRDKLALIDPGPIDDEHIDAILNYCAGRLRWILVTHTHRDHSPAAKIIAEKTGAEVYGNIIESDGRQDDTFDPLCGFVHNDVFTTAEFNLRVLFTPGHVGNHLCYLLEEEKLLFTGDHIMQGSTVVIIPPAGDMKLYIESLQLLLNYPIAALAPAHGLLVLNPELEIKKLIKHRLLREAKVISALQRQPDSTPEALTPLAYDDTVPQLHSIAQYSLYAHLLKLQKENKAVEVDGKWRGINL